MTNPLTMKLEQFTRFELSERIRLDELVSTGRKTYDRGQKILREGDKVDEIHLVLEGLATRSKVIKDGHRQLMAFLVPGDLCDLEVFVLDAMDHDIIAMTQTTCAVIPASDMEQLLTESSNLTRALWWSTMTDSAVLREWIVNHGTREAKARLAHTFCELLIRYRIVGMARDNVMPFPITQEELSDATGITNVHANRVIQQLRAEGLVEQTGKFLRVLDFPALAAVAQWEPHYLHLIRTEHADPAVVERVGDLVPPVGMARLRHAWEVMKQPFAGASSSP
jgi:CRP-like cAMP-binding protein